MKITNYFFCILFSLFFVGCDKKTSQSHNHEPLEKPLGTVMMMDSIKNITKRTNFRKHIYETGEKAKILEKEVNQARRNNKLSGTLYVEYALALLNAGKSQESLDVLEEILAKFPQNKEINQQTKTIHETLALCHLRLGEQNNCIKNHNKESCLFPIKGGGIHNDKSGSKNAISKYKEVLNVFPDDLRSRWLLNLAYMTIGEYPESVPEKYLMHPNLFKSEIDFPEFENVSQGLGVDVGGLAGGVILDDFNGDHWNDIVVSTWGMFGGVRIFYNDKNGGFSDVTNKTGLDGLTGGLNLIQADYDNDGDLDFYIIRGAWRGLEWMGQLPNSLIRNNGDGTFSDVTIESGMYYAAPTQSAVWWDFNCDGLLDLFVGNETHASQEIHKTQLFMNNGDGTFEDIASVVGLDLTAYVKGVNIGDVNNDNKLDLYVSILTGENKLFLNKSGVEKKDWLFEEVSTEFGVGDPKESFPTWFFDYNNDGWDDIFVTSFDRFSLYQQSREITANYLGLKSNSDWPRLYLNENGRAFKDVTRQSGLERVLPTMGCNFGDLDNDGWLDFYLGTGAPDFRAVVPNRMFKNNGGESFADVSYGGNFGHIQKGHGISYADLDNDGDQDIYAVMGGSVTGDVAQNALFENPGFGNNWVNILLEGTRSNRSAIGAKIKLTVEKDGKRRDIYSTVNSGGSFGANSLAQEIGLADSDKVELSIDWPDGKAKYLDYGVITLNQHILINEDEMELNYLKLQPMKFKMKDHVHHHHHNH